MTNNHEVIIADTRRIARLFVHILSIVAGFLYIFFPPKTTINLLETALPAICWGVLFVIGGLICSVSWYKRTLIFDRIGVSLVLIGLGTLIINQIILFFDGPTFTRGGGTVVLLMLFASLIARWQDIYYKERLDREFGGSN